MKPSRLSPRSQDDRAAEGRDVDDRTAGQGVEPARFQEVLDYVWYSLSRLGVPEADRDELAQEVVIAAYKKRHDYDRRRASLGQWCRGFVINIVRNYRRSNHIIMGPFAELTPDLVDEKPGPEEH
jgi:DNA-directed RNA polymerase specialized sigma24 family protein